MVLLNALVGLLFAMPACAAGGGAPAYKTLYNSEAGGGVPAGLPAIMRLIRSKEKELGVFTSSSSRLELGDGAAAFTTAVEAAEDAGGGAVEDLGAPPHQLRPGPPREGGLAVRTLFDLNSDTVKKRSQVKGAGDNNSLAMTLDNKGRPYSRLALSSPDGDLQVYHRGTDYIIYTQAADGRGGVSLKEWLYAVKPGPDGRTAYSWSFESGSKNQAIDLRREPDGGIGVYSRLVAVGIDAADRKKQVSVMETVRKAFRSEVKIGEERLLARLQPVVYWTAAGEKKTADFSITVEGALELSLAELPGSYPLIIDPTLNWGQWLGPNEAGETHISALAVDTATGEIYVGGYVEAPGNISESITWQGAHSGGYEGFVVEIQDGATPVISWGQWLGGAGDDSVCALAVNGDEIYAAGDSGANTSWETITWQGAYSGWAEGFVVEIQDGVTPVINWGQWLGGTSNDYICALVVNGDEIYAGGYSVSATDWETIPWQGSHSGVYEGFVVEIQDGATPVINWGQWLGGTSSDYVRTLAVNGDEIYAGGHIADTASLEAITWQGTYSGSAEGFVVEIQDGATPVINWGQWLGGTSADFVRALAVNGDEIYAAGYVIDGSIWDETITWQGANSGGYEGFVVEIQDGATPVINWGQWLGGTSNEYVYSLAVNSDEIYVGGDAAYLDGWETITWQGTCNSNGYPDGFVVEIQDGATPVINWGQWLSGTGRDYIYALAVNGEQIYAGGYSDSAANWETITWQGAYSGGYEGFVVEIQDGATPALNWGQWLGGGVATAQIRALAVSGDEIYAGGYSGNAANWETITWQGAHSGGEEGFVVEIQDGVTPVINWGQWLGGTGSDYVYALAVNGDEIYAAGNSDASTGWETITWQGSYSSVREGFVVEIQDGATPVINWGQWLGGTGNDDLYALAVNGDEIYAGGTTWSSTGWEAIAWRGAYSGVAEGFVVEIQDGATPVINWGQWLGGTGSDYVYALAVTGDEIYVGGYSSSVTSWEAITWQGAHSGGDEGFVVEIQDGATPVINWGQWLGGTGSDKVYALAVNGDEIYVGGYIGGSISLETITWQGSHSGAYEGFVVEIQDGAAPVINWGQWLGGTNPDYVYALAVNGDEIYLVGSIGGTISLETITWQGAAVGTEGFVVGIQDGATPVINWGQWLGGTYSDYVYCLAINGDKLYAGGYSNLGSGWETMTWQGTHNGVQEAFIVKILPPADPTFPSHW